MGWHLLLITHNKLVHNHPKQHDTRENRGHGQSQTPFSNIGQNETRNESSKEIDHDSNFLRHPLLNQIYSSDMNTKKKIVESLRIRQHTSIRLNPSSNFARSNVVEECDVLSEYSLKIALTNTLRVDFACIHPNVHVNVGAHHDADSLGKALIRKFIYMTSLTYQCKQDMSHSGQQNVEN